MTTHRAKTTAGSKPSYPSEGRWASAAGGTRRVVSGVWNDGRRGVLSMMVRLRGFLESWLMDTAKSQYGMSVARMLFSVAALGILASNFASRYYAFGSGSAWTSELEKPISAFPGIWLFSTFQTIRDNDLAFTIGYLLLAVLALLLLVGYRTKLVMPVFLVLWVSFIELNDMLGDQGDDIFRIALLVMLFADTSSRWSLDARRRRTFNASAHNGFFRRVWRGGPLVPDWFRNLFHNLAVVVLICQVSMVYVSGAFYKASGTSWSSGIALYAPITTQQFGPWPELSAIVTNWGPAVAGLSYMTILVQAFFPGMLLNKWTRRLALLVIFSFHLGIAVLMGLPWFSLCMIGIDAVLIRDVTWQRAARWMRATYLGETTNLTPTDQTPARTTDLTASADSSPEPAQVSDNPHRI